MAINTIFTLEESNITISGGQQLSGFTQGNGSHLVGETITLNNSSFVAVDVNDSDDTNFDDSDNSQTLAVETIYDGTVFASGLRVEAEYELTVQDPDGNTYILLGFNINEPGGTSFATVEGLAFVGGIGEFPPAGVPLFVVSNTEGPSDPFVSLATPTCFTKGCHIKTPDGTHKIEQLRIGDAVLTKDHGSQTIRWVGQSRYTSNQLIRNPKLRPIRIIAGALGNGLPAHDLLVSRQHRMLIKSKIAKRMFNKSEVLVPAIKLIDLPGIFIDDQIECVEYFHLLFDQHEIIFAEDAPTESLLTGPDALKSMSAGAQEEILTIFPEVAELGYAPTTVRLVPKGNQQNKLIARHLKNDKPCLSQEFFTHS